MKPDFVTYAELDRYLFPHVGDRFRSTGEVSPHDFASILYWKASRKLTTHVLRLTKRYSFSEAVSVICAGIADREDDEQKLEWLLGEPWLFRLPTASAILSVLYPDRFTVYDRRVREQLGLEEIRGNRWAKYCDYREAVQRRAPQNLSLRDADRYWWGKSRYESVMRAIE